MRCPNCGFFSFDYLNRCVKCQADLTEERHKLNLPDITPNPISLETIFERIPQMIDKETARAAKEIPLPKPANKPSPLEAGPDIFLEGLGLDMALPVRESEGPKLNSKELELIIEELKIGSK